MPGLVLSLFVHTPGILLTCPSSPPLAPLFLHRVPLLQWCRALLFLFLNFFVLKWCQTATQQQLCQSLILFGIVQHRSVAERVPSELGAFFLPLSSSLLYSSASSHPLIPLPVFFPHSSIFIFFFPLLHPPPPSCFFLFPSLLIIIPFSSHSFLPPPQFDPVSMRFLAAAAEVQHQHQQHSVDHPVYPQQDISSLHQPIDYGIFCMNGAMNGEVGGGIETRSIGDCNHLEGQPQ